MEIAAITTIVIKLRRPKIASKVVSPQSRKEKMNAVTKIAMLKVNNSFLTNLKNFLTR